MSQHDYDITTADANSGVTFRAAVNAALKALASNNIGGSAPAVTFAGQIWVDTGNSLIKLRDSGNTAWITIGSTSAEMGHMSSVSASTITAQHTFSPATAIPPFVLASNAQGQKVIGFDADKVDGCNAGTGANEVLKLNANSRIPISTCPQITFSAAWSDGPDTYACTLADVSAYADGQIFFVGIGYTNTSTTPTLNISSLGAKTIKKGYDVALVAGDIPRQAIFKYNGTNMILLNPQTASVSDLAVNRSKISAYDTGSNTALYALVDGKYTTSTSYVKAIEFYMPIAGSATFSFLLAKGAEVFNNYGRLYKNGSAVGTERILSAQGSQEYTENITFAANDFIQFYFKTSNASYQAYIGHTRMYTNTGVCLPQVVQG